MMGGRSIHVAVVALSAVLASGSAAAAAAPPAVAAARLPADRLNRPTLYDLTAVALDGSSFPLASLKGNVSLVINVASY
jgi:hypothetical protein